MASAPERVALFSGNYCATLDGAARALNTLVAFLERRGVEVLVFSPTVDAPEMEPAGTLVPVASVPVPARSEYRIALGLPRSCRRRLEAFRPSLFHVSAPDLLGLQALRFARRRGIPAVASFHTRFDTYLRYYRAGWLQGLVTGYLRHFYRHCVHVYAPSESMAAALAKDGIGRDVRIWSRGVDCALFNPAKRDMSWRRALGIGDAEVVISIATRLVREKGIDVFADVLDLLARRGVRHRALVIGEGPERGWMQHRMPKAIFTGFATGDALARCYASSDVFFFPSLTETFGIVTLEAMASGVPPVCADATGSRSVVTDGVTGFLVTGGRDAFADRLAALLADAGLRRRIGAASAAHARSYDWETAMQSIYAHYQEAIAAAGGDREAGRRELATPAIATRANP